MNVTRAISWVKAARRDFERFPIEVRAEFARDLTVAAEGGKSERAKPLSGLGSGVIEIAIRFRGDAWRLIYALQVADAIWVVHAFQKKSTFGIATPKHEMDLIRERLKRVEQELRNGR